MSDLHPTNGQGEADASSSNEFAHSEDNRDHENAEIVVGRTGSGEANPMGKLRRTFSCPSIAHHPEGEGSDDSSPQLPGRVPPVFVAGEMLKEIPRYSKSTTRSRSRPIIDTPCSSDVGAAAGPRRKKKKKPARSRSLNDHDRKRYSTGPESTGPSSNDGTSTTTILSSSDTDANSGGPDANPGGASGVSYGPYECVFQNINRKDYLVNPERSWKKEREIKISPDIKLKVKTSLHPCITNSEGEYVLQIKINTKAILNNFPEFNHSAKVSAKLVSPDSNEIFGEKIKTYIFKENSGFNVFMDLALQEIVDNAEHKKLRLEVTLELIQDANHMNYTSKDEIEFGFTIFETDCVIP